MVPAYTHEVPRRREASPHFDLFLLDFNLNLSPLLIMPSRRVTRSRARNRVVTFDHQFFPHTIALIWSFMPYSSLVVATMVCKSWNLDAKKRLLRLGHVIVMESNVEDTT